MSNLQRCDFLIIGAGIIGLALARELKSRLPAADILVIEKEADVAYHGSGRNSGVLHAGFYYSADSLKARFTRDGNRMMTEYVKGRGNVYTHPAITEYNRTSTAANQTVQTLMKIIATMREDDDDTGDELLEFLRRGRG